MDSNPYQPPKKPPASLDFDPHAVAKSRRALVFCILAVVIGIGFTIYEVFQARGKRK